MALGKNVGQVSVRVSPDTTRFKAELERQLASIKDLTVTVNLDLDKGAVQAELDRLKAEKIDIPANVNLDKGLAEAEKAAIGKPITIPAKVDIDQDALGRALAGRKITIPAEVKVDRDPFKEMLRGIVSDARNVFRLVSSEGSDAFASVGKGASTMADALSSAGVSAGSAVTGLVKLGVAGAAVAEAGAAITAAYGAASTAVAAVPAAIGLIAAPLAATLLGLDGIKKAASTLAPEFTKLKSAVSSTFQQQLTPVFNQLKGTLTALTPQVRAVATSMVGLAQQTANWITNLGGLQQIQLVFSNVAAALGRINLVPLLDGFTRLAGNAAAMDVLVTAINGVGTALQSIADNTALNGAFDGLKNVISSLETALTDLVNNGIKLFKEAAPGVQAAIDGIGSFLNKFDWAKLGGAVGSALRGVGDALKQIPQSTVDQITGAFEHLGQTLNSPDFKAAVGVAASWTSGIIGYLDSLIQKISATILELDRLKQALSGGANSPFKPGNVGDTASIENLKNDIRNNVPGVEQELARLPKAYAQKLRETVAAENAGAQQVAAAAAGAGKAATNAYVGSLATVQPAQRGILGALPGFAASDLAPLPGLFADKANAARLGFGTGLRNMSAEQAAALGVLPGQADASLAPLADTSIPTATQNMVNAVNAAIPGLGTAFQTGFTALGPLVDTAFQALATTNVATGMAAIGTAVATGFATTVSLAVGTGMLQMQNAVTLGLVGVGTAFTTGLGLIGTQVTTFFATTMSLAVGTGMLQVQNAVTLGLVGVGTAFTAGLGLIGTQVTTFFATTMSLAVGTGMLQVANAVTLGMAGVSMAFTQGFANVNAAVSQAMTNVAAAFTAGFANVNTAVTQGMANALTAVNQGMANLTTAVQTGGQDMTTAITTTMTNFNTAITQGAAKAVQAVTDMMAKIKAAIPPDALTAVGRALIEGMAKGMIAGIPAVEAAARQAVQRAVAAAQSEANTGSPSKVFRDEVGRWLTLGQAAGQLAELGAVEDAARQQVQAALAAARYEIAHAPDLAQAFLDQTGLTDFNAQMDAAFSSGAFDTSGGSSGDLYVTVQNVMDGKVLDERTHKIVAADKQDFLMKLRAG